MPMTEDEIRAIARDEYQKFQEDFIQPEWTGSRGASRLTNNKIKPRGFDSLRKKNQGPPYSKHAGANGGILYKISDVRDWLDRCCVDPAESAA